MCNHGRPPCRIPSPGLTSPRIPPKISVSHQEIPAISVAQGLGVCIEGELQAGDNRRKERNRHRK
ncbi:hypothetical protein AKJ16_DCAP06279 [Drosera capensis]